MQIHQEEIHIDKTIYIGDIASEAYGYVHLVGKQATLKRHHPLLPLTFIHVAGEDHPRWIATSDSIAIGDTCAYGEDTRT